MTARVFRQQNLNDRSPGQSVVSRQSGHDTAPQPADQRVAELSPAWPQAASSTDEQIAARGAAILQRHALMTAGGTQIIVHRGWARIAGHVTWQYQRSMVEHAIRKIPGVHGIINEIAVVRRSKHSESGCA